MTSLHQQVPLFPVSSHSPLFPAPYPWPLNTPKSFQTKIKTKKEILYQFLQAIQNVAPSAGEAQCFTGKGSLFLLTLHHHLPRVGQGSGSAGWVETWRHWAEALGFLLHLGLCCGMLDWDWSCRSHGLPLPCLPSVMNSLGWLPHPSPIPLGLASAPYLVWRTPVASASHIQAVWSQHPHPLPRH